MVMILCVALIAFSPSPPPSSFASTTTTTTTTTTVLTAAIGRVLCSAAPSCASCATVA